MASRQTKTQARRRRRSRRWLQFGIVFAGIIFFLVTSCCALPIGVSSVYQWGAVRSVPDFDALNESLLNEIPLPAGSTLVTKRSYGILDVHYSHGRTLFAGYLIDDYAGPGALQEHFHTVLVDLGYSELSIRDYRQQYARNNQCVAVVLDSGEGVLSLGDEQFDFTLWIHVDYRTQSFSPWVPPEWVMPWIGGLKYEEARCP